MFQLPFLCPCEENNEMVILGVSVSLVSYSFYLLQSAILFICTSLFVSVSLLCVRGSGGERVSVCDY